MKKGSFQNVDEKRSEIYKKNMFIKTKLIKKYPNHNFRLSNKISVQRKFGSRWCKVCIHNIVPYTCKKCNGHTMCVHKKRKSRCKLGCGGASICNTTGKRKYICSCDACGGKGLCKAHKHQKTNCKQCKDIKLKK